MSLFQGDANRVFQVSVGAEFEHGEILRRADLREFRIERPAHAGIVAVGANHELRLQFPCFRDDPLGVGDDIAAGFFLEFLDEHAGAVLAGGDGGRLLPPADAHPELFQLILQQVFERILADHGERVAGVAGLDGDARPVAVAKGDAMDRIGCLQDPLPKPQRREQVERLGVHGQRIAVGAGPDAGVNDADVHVAARQRQGGEQTHRTGADDEDFGFQFIKHGGHSSMNSGRCRIHRRVTL